MNIEEQSRISGANGGSAESMQVRAPPRQNWIELPPPDPENREASSASLSGLLSPISGEEGSSSSPIETLDRAEETPRQPYDHQHGHAAFAGGGGGNVSQKARQRIREKAKSLVEKQKRLAKRMVKSQRSVEGIEVAEVPGNDLQQNEIVQVDQQIEQSIQIGSKYLEGLFHWDQSSAAVLMAADHSADQPAALEERNRQRPFLFLSSARPSSADSTAKFRQMLVWRGGGGTSMGDLEMGQKLATAERDGDSEPTKGTSTKPVLAQQSYQGSLPFSFPGGHLLIWRSPLAWDDWVQQSGSRRWASQKPKALWLDLQGLEFGHHWLFTRAEAAQLELLAAFDGWAEVHQQMLRAIKEWLALRQRLETDEGTSEEKVEDGAERSREERGEERTEEVGEASCSAHQQMDIIYGRILELREQLDRCRAALARAWAGADQSRGRFLLERLEGHAEVFEQESEGGVPEELKQFFHSPVFVLSERQRAVEAQQQMPAAGRLDLEKQRRASVSNCRYQVKVFFNELLVATSDEAALQWPSFSLSIGQIFSLRIFERPEQLRLALSERFGRANWQPVANIFVPLPADGLEEEEVAREGTNQSNKWMAETGLQFASTTRGSYKGSLGCGGHGGVPFMHGRLFCSLRWQHNARGQTGHRATKVEQRRAEVRLGLRTSAASLFPEGTLLCPEEALQTDQRLLALQRRWTVGQKSRANGASNQGRQQQQQPRIGPQMTDQTMLGGRGAEEVEAKVTGGQQQQAFDRHGEMELEMRRRLGREFALALRRQLRESGEQRRRAQDLAELVREEPMPQPSLSLLQALLANRQVDVSRRLKPHRNPAAAAGRPLADPLMKSRLVLNIQHASGIPQRANHEPTQIFLLCSLQHQSQATTLVDGRHSNWQETLVLNMPNGDQLDQSQYLEVEMFDRELLPMEYDDREQDTRHERVQKRWLGSARIPLAALQRKVDGHLALRGPLFHTGYRPSGTTPVATCVRLLISLDPPPLVPPGAPVDAPMGESETNLIADCLKFEARLRQRFPGRRVHPLVLDASGKRVLASRFLRKLAPPPQVVNMFGRQPQRAVHLTAQMVASIPAFHDSSTDSAKPLIWSTADEVLRIGTASPDELGLLLCCWLLGLDLPAVLLLGASLADGPSTAFVLVQLGDGLHWLISPGDGHFFAPSDPSCPLLSVGTVLSPENVFVNVQREQHPSQLDFDLRKKAHWEPLFADGRKNLVSLQPETLRYEPVDENSLMELRTRLEREIRLHFDESRPFAIPQWNLLASRSLRELLADSWGDLGPADPTGSTAFQPPLLLDVDGRLSHLRLALQLSALAFRLPFISRAQVVRQVLRTRMHNNSDQQAQFALAVHLQPFFGTFICCSVAICALLPNNVVRN